MNDQYTKGRLNIIGSGDEARIEVYDDSSGVRVIEVRLPVEQFAQALMNRGHIPCDYHANYRNADLFGAEVEVKSEEVPFDMYRNKSEAAIEKALAPYEVDGWQARRSDMRNGHCRVRENGLTKPRQRVSFTRFVRNGEPIVRTMAVRS